MPLCIVLQCQFSDIINSVRRVFLWTDMLVHTHVVTGKVLFYNFVILCRIRLFITHSCSCIVPSSVWLSRRRVTRVAPITPETCIWKLWSLKLFTCFHAGHAKFYGDSGKRRRKVVSVSHRGELIPCRSHTWLGMSRCPFGVGNEHVVVMTWLGVVSARSKIVFRLLKSADYSTVMNSWHSLPWWMASKAMSRYLIMPVQWHGALR